MTGKALHSDNARVQFTGDSEDFDRLVVDADSRELVGVCVMGESATELVHIGRTAVQLGARVDTFIQMILNYPSLTVRRRRLPTRIGQNMGL